MPCLRLFRRRWGVADDDVVFAATPWLFHLVWVILLPILLQNVDPPTKCERDNYRLAVIALFILMAIALVEETAIAIVALRGSIFDSHKRRAIQPLLCARAVSILLETAFLIYATVVVVRPDVRCPASRNDQTVWHPPTAVKAWIWSTWATTGITYIITALTYKFWPEMDKEKSWERRVRLVAALCCCSSRVAARPEPSDDGHTEATPLARMALVFASMFGFVDMTASDFLAAFLLASQLQRCRRRRALHHLAEAVTEEDAENGHVTWTSDTQSQHSSGSPAAMQSPMMSPHGSMRRRATSGGIAEAEAGDLHLQEIHWPLHRHKRHTEGGSLPRSHSGRHHGMGHGGSGHGGSPAHLWGRRHTLDTALLRRSQQGAAEEETSEGNGRQGVQGDDTIEEASQHNTSTVDRLTTPSSTPVEKRGAFSALRGAIVPLRQPESTSDCASIARRARSATGNRSSRSGKDKEEQERLAAEGRRLLKAAEAAADRGTTALDGFVAPAPARAGSFIRSMSAVGDIELQGPVRMVERGEGSGVPRAPVAELLGDDANPPADPDSLPRQDRGRRQQQSRSSMATRPQSDDGMAKPSKSEPSATAQQPAVTDASAPADTPFAHAQPSFDTVSDSGELAAQASLGFRSGSVSGPPWRDNRADSQVSPLANGIDLKHRLSNLGSAASTSAGAELEARTSMPRPQGWRRFPRSPFRTNSLWDHPSRELEQCSGDLSDGTSIADAAAPAPAAGLLTPSGMAGDLRPERSAASNLATFSGAREPVSDDDVAEAAHYAKYSYAAYGFLMFVFGKPIYSGIFQLCCGRWFGLMRTLLFSRSTWRLRNLIPSKTAKPIPNALNREAIQQITGLQDRDVVFVRFEGEGGKHCLPYFIGLDHEKQSVVLSIRGTLSLEDAMTDLLCDSARLDDWMKEVPSGSTPSTFTASQPPKREAGVDSKFAAHAGILDAAKAIVQDLQETGVLRALFHYEPAEVTSEAVEGDSGDETPDDTIHSGSVSGGGGGSGGDGVGCVGISGGGGNNGGGGASGKSTPKPGHSRKSSAVNLVGLNGTSSAGPSRTASTTTAALSTLAGGTERVLSAVRSQALAIAPAIQRMVPLTPTEEEVARQLRDMDCREWKLVVTGHSLGAGAAALVALYAHNFFPRVKAWCYEPPGGLMTRTVSRALQPLCTSTALGKDIIPRLSVASFERMRDDMMMASVRCKVSKWPFIIATLCGWKWREDTLFRSAEEVPPGPAAVLAQYRENVSQARPLQHRKKLDLARQFVMPGRVMFLRPVKADSRPKHRRARKAQYEAVWITCDDLAHEGILVSSRMMAEHMPDRLTRVLERLAEARTGDPQGPSQAQLGDDFAPDVPTEAAAGISSTSGGRSQGSTLDHQQQREPGLEAGTAATPLRRSATSVPSPVAGLTSGNDQKGLTSGRDRKGRSRRRQSLTHARPLDDMDFSASDSASD